MLEQKLGDGGFTGVSCKSQRRVVALADDGIRIRAGGDQSGNDVGSAAANAIHQCRRAVLAHFVGVAPETQGFLECLQVTVLGGIDDRSDQQWGPLSYSPAGLAANRGSPQPWFMSL